MSHSPAPIQPPLPTPRERKAPQSGTHQLRLPGAVTAEIIPTHVTLYGSVVVELRACVGNSIQAQLLAAFSLKGFMSGRVEIRRSADGSEVRSYHREYLDGTRTKRVIRTMPDGVEVVEVQEGAR